LISSWGGSSVPPVYLSEDEFEEWKEKKQGSTQQRVLTLFTMWLEDHNMIKEDPHIVHRLQGFLQSIIDPHPIGNSGQIDH
jgi:son of sevenless-like protein